MKIKDYSYGSKVVSDSISRAWKKIYEEEQRRQAIVDRRNKLIDEILYEYYLHKKNLHYQKNVVGHKNETI